MSSRGEDRWSRWHVVIPRAAFTLVELLVVIAIIGSLIALLIPAVQSARESARRVTCSNRAKQIALAALTYEDARRELPQGTVTFMFCALNNAWTVRDQRHWGQLLLPYLEHQALYDKVVATLPNTASDWIWNLVPDTLTPVETFQCPSDPNAGKRVTFLTAQAPIERGFYSNYRGVAGSTVFNPNVSAEQDARMDPEGAEPAASHYTDGGTRLNGLLFARSAIKLRQVTDGLSKTMLVTEGVNVPRNDSAAGYQDARGLFWGLHFYGTSFVSTGEPPNTSVGDRSRVCVSHPRAPCDGATLGSAGPSYQMRNYARSYHTGVQAGMADGSVNFMVESVSPVVWKALGTRAGGD